MKHHFSLDPEKIHLAYNHLTALHSPIRIRIVDLIRQNCNLSISQISEKIRLDEEGTKRHIKKLLLTGIIRKEFANKLIYFRVDESKIEALNIFLMNEKCQVSDLSLL